MRESHVLIKMSGRWKNIAGYVENQGVHFFSKLGFHEECGVVGDFPGKQGPCHMVRISFSRS